jgi:hypothetical protein
MQTIDRNNTADTRAPPQNGILVLIPREDPLAIGIYKSGGGEIAANREKPIGLLNRLTWVGKLRVVTIQ